MRDNEYKILEPIREVVLRCFEPMRQRALSMTPLSRVEEHRYDWGVSWNLSVLASPDSDEVTTSVVAQVSTGHVEIDADLACANAVLEALSTHRFSTTDAVEVARVARALSDFLVRVTPRFEIACRELVETTKSSA